jgi:protein gp37
MPPQAYVLADVERKGETKIQKTKIEWCDYTVNPVKGYCPMACPYCYARRMYDRFKWDKTIRFDQTAFFSLPSKPSRIFVGSTIELFGDWIYPEWLKTIFTICKQHTEHTFIFLTKQPWNLARWNPWPENTWVGTSVESSEHAHGRGISSAMEKVQAKVKFISAEPLQDEFIGSIPTWCSWLIIGAETGNRKEKPPLAQVQEWAKEIIKVADEAGTPVFLKDNLKLPARREWPK